MSAGEEFRFLHPHWLLLLPALWLMLALCARRFFEHSAWRRLCDARLLAYLAAGQGRRGGHGPALVFIGIILTLGIVAIAGPSWSRVEQPLQQASTARVIVLDLSRAMLVQDVKPDRLQHARAAAAELIGNDLDAETGLVVFSGAAFVVAPLSRDAETLRAFVEAMHPDTMPVAGYDLAQAIDTARRLLAASFSGHGDILVLSAGDGDDEDAVRAAAEAAERGHRVSILTIGSHAGGPLVAADGGLLRDDGGNVQLSRVNLALLQRIANAGNGLLSVAVSDLDGGDLLMSRIGAARLVESMARHDNTIDAAADDGAWLVWLALPMALLLFRKNVVCTLLVFILLASAETEVYAAGQGAFWRHPERLAFDAYSSADFDTAARLSSDPLLLGASLYRQGRYLQALQQFSDGDSAVAMYNRGNTLVQLGRYAQALQAYQQALRLDPELVDARYNERLLDLFLQQRHDTETDPASQDSEDSVDRPFAQEAADSQLGTGAEMQGNPADQDSLSAGAGATQQAGQVDPLQRFDGKDAQQQRFVLRARGTQQLPDNDVIDRWMDGLAETSTELYRRKFLRDYHRQRRQPH